MVKIKIHNTYGWGMIVFGICLAVFGIFSFIAEFPSIINIIVGVIAMILAILAFSKYKKQHDEVIECERYEVIEDA